MKFKEAVYSTSTTLELTRVASAYVIDYSRLNTQEIKEALIKTAPQYSHLGNLQISIEEMIINKDRDIQVLGVLILKTLLLNSDDFMSSHRDTENEILAYEQRVIRSAAQDVVSKNSEDSQNFSLFQFVIEISWENNDKISPDEKNLIEKLKKRLCITDYEYQLIEAGLGKYPKSENELHTKKEINNVRTFLQKMGLLFSIRDAKGNDYDIIPEEVAKKLRQIWGLEIREYGYGQMLKSKYVKNKAYVQYMLEKSGIYYSTNMTATDLHNLCIQRVKPSILLGGFNSRDGLDVTTLSAWCQDLDLHVSGQKNEIIQRIINSYDDIRKRPSESTIDEKRAIFFEYFEKLASRDLTSLRHQNIIKKDIECERYFEQATNYLFEKYLGHKPLVLQGAEHPDGILSINDKLIYWDNKSKESDINLADHMKQFDRYITSAEKPVASFVVIGPSFTENSIKECKKYSMSNNTTICLITAKQLKSLALSWKKETPYPLQYFRQSGLFDSDI